MKKQIILTEDEWQKIEDDRRELREFQERVQLAPYNVIMTVGEDGLVQILRVVCQKHHDLPLRRLADHRSDMNFYCVQCSPHLKSNLEKLSEEAASSYAESKSPQTLPEEARASESLSGAPDDERLRKLHGIEMDGRAARALGTARKKNPYDVDFEPAAWRAWDDGWKCNSLPSEPEPLNTEVSLPQICPRHGDYERGVMRQGRFQYLCVHCEREENVAKLARRQCEYFLVSEGSQEVIRCEKDYAHTGLHQPFNLSGGSWVKGDVSKITNV